MRKKKPNSLAGRIRRFVCSRPESTINQITGSVGRYISESSAMAVGRSGIRSDQKRKSNRFARSGFPTPEQVAKYGRHRLIGTTLSLLLKRGEIRRISKGVYGPPLPRIHTPAAEAS